MQLFQNGSPNSATFPTKQALSGPAGYANSGPPGVVQSTRLDPDVVNTVLAEFIAVLTAASISPDPTDNGQLLKALKALYGTGRLVGIQTFVAAGAHTYTPNPAAKTCIARVQAGGGAGGGAGSAGSGNVSLGAPGCSGSYAEGEYSAASLAGLTITVGAGGVAVSGGAGGNGGASSIGTVMVCPGGPAGSTLTNQVPPTTNGNGNSSTAASGGNIFASVGSCNSPTIALTNLTGFGGSGGASLFGPGGFSSNPNVTGFSALNYGSGGAGVMVNASGGTIFGGAGQSGIVIIYEYS